MFPPSTHARFSPSKLQQFIDCPGSFKLVQKYENQQSKYAQEGEMLHFATEQCIQKDLTSPPKDLVLTEYGVELNDEQVIAVADCVFYYNNVLKTTAPGAKVSIEQQVALQQYDSSLFECSGTCDIIIYDTPHLHVIDWKFGQGVPVYSSNNDQLYAYAAGALVEFGLSFTDIHIHVVQPRLDIYDKTILTVQELKNWMNMRLIPGAKRAYSDDAPFSPGKKQCKFCSARFTCRARNNFANQTAADIFAAHATLDKEVSIEELAEVMKNSGMYQDYISDIAKYIKAQLMSGKEVPGWKMVAGRSNRSWADESEAEEWLNEKFSYDQIYTQKMVTPAQAEKLDRAVKKDKEFLSLVIKPEGKPTLVPAHNKGTALVFRTAGEVFADDIQEDDENGA